MFRRDPFRSIRCSRARGRRGEAAVRPIAVALDGAGNLLVAEAGDAELGGNQVRKVHGVAAAGPIVEDPAPKGLYHPLPPVRLLDTRNGTGGFSAPAGPGSAIALAVTGVGAVPVTGASAVVLNLTVTEPTAESFLTVFPSGTTRPNASSLNFKSGQTVANLVVAKVGAGGKVSIYNNAGGAQVIADLVGWYGAEGTYGGSGYNSLPPARVLDSRTGTGGVSAAMGPASSIAVAVTGAGGVPATGVSGVALNLTVTEPTAESFLTVFPSGTTRPNASSLNFKSGQTVANLVVAKVGAGGKVSIYNNVGGAHVIADVVGWYGADGAYSGSRYTTLDPVRILDSRAGAGGFSTAVGPTSSIAVIVTGVGGVPATGVSAVVLNLTATQPTAESFLTVFPSGRTRPNASTLNFKAGQTVANLVVAKVGADGKVSIFNNAGTVHVVADVVGWYS